ncbi:hypothetical protein Tco_1216526 [Tanacetum coccineum]
MSKRARSTRGHASSSCDETLEEKVRKFGLFNNETYQINYNNLVRRSIHSEDVMDWFGGEESEMPLLKFGWRVGLYSERESRDVATLSGLRNAKMVNATHFTYMFWPTIGDGGYNVGNTKAKSIRNARIKLAHRCITMTIVGRKETTNRVIEIDLFYLYCIFGERGLFVTSPIGSLKLHEGECFWPATREVAGEGGGDDKGGDGEGGNEGVGGSTDVYRNMSACEWKAHQAK